MTENQFKAICVLVEGINRGLKMITNVIDKFLKEAKA